MNTISRSSTSCDPVDVLLDLLETGSGSIPARPLRERFPDALVYLEQIGAVQPDAILTEVTCDECHFHHSAALEFDTSRHAYRFFCPDAGFVIVADADIAGVRVNPAWLMDWLAGSLSFISQIRRRSLIESRAWLLGETVLDGTTVAVALVLGRVGAYEQDALIQVLSRFQPSEIGIVLTTSAELPSALLAPYRYHSLEVREIVCAKTDGLALDYSRLTARVIQFLRGAKATKGTGGRSSPAENIRKFFEERRNGGIAYRYKSGEATEIRNAWPARFPGQKVPGHSTIRNALPAARSAASEDQASDPPSCGKPLISL
jgi:hypothetical protein